MLLVKTDTTCTQRAHNTHEVKNINQLKHKIMAKYYNNRIKTGKVAGSVFAVRYGEVIERAYNPIVANPKSANQVSARAKLKLLSQLSAVMGGVIAIPRDGAVSPRNIFVKLNYENVTYSDGNTSIQLDGIKLTRSVLSLPQLGVTRSGENVAVSISGTSQTELNRVVYVVFQKTADNELRFVASQVVSTPGANNYFPVTFEGIADLNIVVYAYGMRDNNERARATFGNLTVPTAETVAKLIVTRELTLDDVTLTETRGVVSNVQ